MDGSAASRDELITRIVDHEDQIEGGKGSVVVGVVQFSVSSSSSLSNVHSALRPVATNSFAPFLSSFLWEQQNAMLSKRC